MRILDSINVVANIPPRMMITANGLKENRILDDLFESKKTNDMELYANTSQRFAATNQHKNTIGWSKFYQNYAARQIVDALDKLQGLMNKNTKSPIED